MSKPPVGSWTDLVTTTLEGLLPPETRYSSFYIFILQASFSLLNSLICWSTPTGDSPFDFKSELLESNSLLFFYAIFFFFPWKILSFPVVLKLGLFTIWRLLLWGNRWKVSSGWNVVKFSSLVSVLICCFWSGDLDFAFFILSVKALCRNGFFCTDLETLFFSIWANLLELFCEWWFGELKVDLFSVDLASW